ncbi:DUF2948 family protein [Rhodothalassium salexigens DSM 2132]|uniref:DUF2948 family protein n=1 Tax=Rhodothalassium salexigens DSM 2132 TaxID=1188247 RepID=A0A4R2PMI5_RHOSA|nr:DUF2948 family protein [Rhodothalassium salexigens]MBB4211334.1 hypothetical protein [Rhodothalassium salexigens DSM 2132]MBK1639500.1 hypothetical protein [Rhodothalassium salexigens DSM 2132]TCP35255.1 DUF2948 family protein [Rhodothalassium salexigens DSM 2132]
MAKKPLKLVARTTEDVEVVSALLQDATVKVGDMTYRPGERRFACVVNRYRWEGRDGRRRRRGERVRAGVHADFVQAARVQNLSLDQHETVLDLLAIRAEVREGGPETLTFVFAGGAAIELTVDGFELVLEDISQPWRARRRPEHALD